MVISIVCHIPVDMMEPPGEARCKEVRVLETGEKEVDEDLIH